MLIVIYRRISNPCPKNASLVVPTFIRPVLLYPRPYNDIQCFPPSACLDKSVNQSDSNANS
jgi:hypothetical protein